jgi:hypothetical protein
MLQGFVLHLDVGIWSGNRRKMEIATSHGQAPIIVSQIVITYATLRLIRKPRCYERPEDLNDRPGSQLKSLFMTKEQLSKRNGKSGQLPNPTRGLSPETLSVNPKLLFQPLVLKPFPLSHCEILVQQLTVARLCFHLFLRDAETSMTTLVNPILSYAEVTLPLPSPKELWLAKSAQEWKAVYLSRMNANPDAIPSLLDIIRDSSNLAIHQSHIDLQFSASIYLHAIWGMIFEYRQLDAIHRLTSTVTHTSNTNIVLSSRHADLTQTLYTFQLLLQDFSTVLFPQEPLLLNHMLMFLNLSLDDLQLFAGKDGEENARRVYPNLQRWAESRESRQALWHAGQVLRAAKLFPRNHLKDFYAVAVHHASLALWAYGVVTNANARSAHNMGLLPPQNSNEVIWLDGQESLESQRFIATGNGRPSIQGPGGKVGSSVEDCRGCMDICYEVLRTNCGGEGDAVPPIVENLCVLIKQLGNAAYGL